MRKASILRAKKAKGKAGKGKGLSKGKSSCERHGYKDMVEKIVFVAMMVIAAVGGIIGCIYELGGKKKSPDENQNSGEKECEEA